MAVPKIYEFYSPILTLLSDEKPHTIKEIREYCADKLQVTEDDRNLSYRKRGANVLSERVNWAKIELKVAGLLESPKRAEFIITQSGKDILEKGITLTARYVHSLWKHGKSSEKTEADSQVSVQEPQTPQELIENAISELKSVLIDKLLTEINNMNPYDFERLVVDLLLKMGYGSPEQNQDAVTKKSGDEGIDGIVKADRFGFDAVYTQAKKWKEDSFVGRPEIQKFLGAVAGQGATKGLYITTGQFTKEAKDFAARQLNHKIILIDGKQLAELMIEYDLGVTTVKTYPIKRIDSDYFDADN
ncbi:MAG: restriction endonuclease [Synergistaceae bacterium]|nr:restriction endonuclease [Synergistaceae bacterium]